MKKIKSRTYTSNVFSSSYKEALIFRRHSYDSEKEVVDVHAGAWTLAYAQVEPESIYLNMGSDWIELKGGILLFIPPFSILRWKIRNGTLKWMYFLSLNNIEIANKIPAKIITNFDFKVLPLFRNANSVLKFAKEADGILPNIDSRNDVVSSLKLKIDARFSKTENIKDMLNQKQNYAYISRQFKARYWMSPVEYRNQLRLMQTSYDLMFEKKSILETSSNNGITDSKFFYQKFNKLLRTNPSSFILKK